MATREAPWGGDPPPGGMLDRDGRVGEATGPRGDSRGDLNGRCPVAPPTLSHRILPVAAVT